MIIGKLVIKVCKIFILSHVDVRKTKDPRNPLGNSRCECSRSFHLKKAGLSLEVCKDMFLNTLSISNSKVNTILKVVNENVGIKQIAIKKRNPMPSKGFFRGITQTRLC